MKKRLFVIATVLALLVGLVIMTTSATEQSTLQAGYAVVSISPFNNGETDLAVGLPMPGYGTATDRLSTGFINDDGDDTNGTIDAGHELMATVIAVTDADGNTALLISADTATTNQNWTNTARSRISSATGVAYNNIFIHATGTLSAPEISYGYSYTDEQITNLGQSEDAADQALYTRLTNAKTYREYVYTQLVAAAETAMADRTEVVMRRGSLDVSDAILTANAEATTAQQRMVYNTHYKATKTVDGVETTLISGHDFGPSITSSCSELYEPDDALQLLQFVPTDTTKLPIVLANWNALPNLASNSYTAYGLDHRYKISSDYIGSFRNTLAADPTTGEQVYRTAFIAGTSNNIAAFHRLYTNWDPDITESYTPTIRPDSVSSTLKSRPSIIPTKYGQKLAAAAMYALSTDGVMTNTASGKIQTMPMQFSTDPNLPTQEQIDLVNALKSASAPEGSGYSSLYAYLIGSSANWKTKADYEETYPFLAQINENFELAGMSERASHTVYSNRTDFATDATYCEMHAMMIGDEVALVLSPMELYDRYSKTATIDDISDNDWDNLRAMLPGSLFIATNTNGASSVVPNYLSGGYNADSDTYATGSRDFNYCAFARGTGEDVITTYSNMFASLTAGDGDHKYYCECGGTAIDNPNHTCTDIEWLAWSDPKNLPASGNYYLTCDVTFQRRIAVNRGTLRIDLNGHTLTRKVQPEEILVPGSAVPEGDYYTATHGIIVSGSARLVITDSSEGTAGKFTRDVSALSETDQRSISNFGLLVRLETSSTNGFTLYAGTMDASDQYGGGGCCVSNSSSKATFKMFGGTLLGGVSDCGTVVYNAGKFELLGGQIVGGTVADSAYDDDNIAENYGAVYVKTDAVLTLGGNTCVTGNVDAEGNPNNIALGGTIKIKNGYTGTAGITLLEAPYNGKVIGERESAVTDENLLGKITLDTTPAEDPTNYSVVTLDVTKVMIAELRDYCECGGQAVGKLEHTCQDITWKPWPYSASLPASSVGGSYYLLNDVILKSQRAITNTTIHLDLNGHDITHQVQPETINLEKRSDENTRVLNFTKNVTFTVTDTTPNEEEQGVITRDLSLIAEEYASTITNWGLMMIINDSTVGNITFYAGTMDATGMVAGGGSCVAQLSANAVFTMYGGTAKGGSIASSGVIYATGPVKLYGGLVTGAIGQKQSNAGYGVRIVSLDKDRVGKLYLAGDASVTGNYRANGTTPNNILVSTGYENFTVIGKYTGTAGISLAQKPYEA